jgi:hypothetical protein
MIKKYICGYVNSIANLLMAVNLTSAWETQNFVWTIFTENENFSLIFFSNTQLILFFCYEAWSCLSDQPFWEFFSALPLL